MTDTQSYLYSIVQKYNLVKTEGYRYIPNMPLLTFSGSMLKYESCDDSIYICEPKPNYFIKTNTVIFFKYNLIQPNELEDYIQSIFTYLNDCIHIRKQEIIKKNLHAIEKDF